ncbi:PREDICTED: uncharacterized protein LOC104820904 isoform X2 [Tarenaya hassleriana]|uniref:uncharacterized protein LOC104820904 isoform X2 n=1 Tax=Tarenaya hassleriana TaxID=28532 RepID=UPI00053C0BDB|nr:PREDICTED: uncharacterized protein LOC104820904 isoform X2 [Tarenaya hassleriana]
MASCIAPFPVSGGSLAKEDGFSTTKFGSIRKTSGLTIQRKSNRVGGSHRFGVSAAYRGGSSDFVAGFLLGGAVFGTVAYIFAPQIRRSLLNEDENGFRKPRQPAYYDEGLEKTRQTLNEKIGQLNSAIDNVSSRLRGGGNSSSSPAVPVETDPEVEATT